MNLAIKQVVAVLVVQALLPCVARGQEARSGLLSAATLGPPRPSSTPAVLPFASYPSGYFIETEINQAPPGAKTPGAEPTKEKDGPNAPQKKGQVGEPGAGLMQPAPPIETEVQEQPERGGNLGIGSFDDRFTGRAIPITFVPPAILNATARVTQPPPVPFSIALPSAGGVVGLEKVSENNSPLPRDRIIFDYSFYNGTVLTPGGFYVDRFVVGFEKTFFNGRASFELRLPFAATLDSTTVAGGLTSSTFELGDLHLALKGIVYANRILTVSAGLAADLPTASNETARLADGTPLIRIDNDSAIFTPFVAALYTPNDRLFAQAWLELGVDASGSPVYSSNPQLGGFNSSGRVYGQTILQLDTQIGYWLLQPGQSAGFLTGLAPFFEVHFNQALTTSNLQGLPSTFAVGASNPEFSEVNLAAGVNTLFSNRLNMIAGIVVPVSSGISKFFDFEVGLRFNWLFGPGG
jgi:hypothetical protein